MDQDLTVGALILGGVLWLFIMYYLIQSAIKSALVDQNYNLKMQNRLLIKMLNKQGVSKQALVDLHNDDLNKFWDSIEA